MNVEELVTTFLLNTCRLRPQYGRPAVEAAMPCVHIITNNHFENEPDADVIPITTGSVAEFYIEPMLSHIGDIDVMFHLSTMLAIPRGHPPPTQLPVEFHSCVKVFEIIDSHLPGYVYLGLCYLLRECVDDGKYNATEYDRQNGTYFLLNRYLTGDQYNMHGPAVLEVFPSPSKQLPRDFVFCVRCLVWPSQAADWPTRRRNYGWPDSATVVRVVSKGCDVVPVVHRQCRQHEEMSQYQHRLSFSRAEIVLLNSWIPVQQIIYHMLRVFLKTERLIDSADNSEVCTLSNYHIKTLMLWACELKPRTWWVNEFKFVRICAQLLHVLGVWLTDKRCQHYFINNCNLIDSTFNVRNIGGQLMSVYATWLTTWFVHNYIRKCSELCPENIAYLLENVNTSVKLQDAVSAVVTWRRSNSLLDFWGTQGLAKYLISFIICHYSLSTSTCTCLMAELANLDPHLFVYFTAVAFLHVVRISSTHGLNDELMDGLSTLLEHYEHFRPTSRQNQCQSSTSLYSLRKAAKLMKVVANKSLSTMSLIAIELSKAYLCRVLRCKDSDSDSIYRLANVYLAVLYYTTGQYQLAIDHCTLVMRSQDQSMCSSHVVQGELLPKIDDNIDTVLGLAVFYQHVRTAALNQRYQGQHVSVLTTKLFAYHLHVKCLSLKMCRQFTQTKSTDEFRQYESITSDTTHLFIGDVLLFVSSRRFLKNKLCHKTIFQQSHQLTVNQTEYDESVLQELLQKSAIEHLTTFRQIEARDFGSVATIVTTDFEALYAYKCGDYPQCLLLLSQNLNRLLCTTYLSSFLTFPDFIQLLDDDIVSLTALTLLVNPECRMFLGYVIISHLTLSLYLMTQCQIKLRHSASSLAQTLDYIIVAHEYHDVGWTLARLVLRMTAHKALTYITTVTN